MNRKKTIIAVSALVLTLVSGLFIIFNKNEKTVKLFKPEKIIEETVGIDNKTRGVTNITLKYDTVDDIVVGDTGFIFKTIYEDKTNYIKYDENQKILVDIEEKEYTESQIVQKSVDEVDKDSKIVFSKDNKRKAFYDKTNKNIVLENIDAGTSVIVEELFDDTTIMNLEKKLKFAYHGGYISLESGDGIAIIGADSGKVYLKNSYGGKSTKWAPDDLRFAYIYLVENSRNRVGFYNVKSKKYVFSPKLSTYQIDEIVDWIDDDKILLIAKDNKTGLKEMLVYYYQNNIYKFLNESKGFSDYSYSNGNLKLIINKDDNKYDVSYYDLINDEQTFYGDVSSIRISDGMNEKEMILKEFNDGTILFSQLDTLYLQKDDLRSVVTYDIENTKIQIVDDRYIFLIGNKNNLVIYDLKEL